MSMDISIVINTYNAERQLAATLESVKDFHEVVVCDMESTDRTVDIARRYGCKVVTFPKGNHHICEPARDFAIHSATTDWVLVVDADEVVTPELRDCLYRILEDPNHKDAYFVPRKNMFLGQFVKASFPDWQLRFLDQTKATWPPTIHSHPQIDGTTGYLPKREACALVHAGMTVAQQLRKTNDYTDSDLQKRGQRSVSLWQLMFSPTWRFLKYYLFDGAVLEGRVGFIKAAFSACGKFYYLAKVYERQVTEAPEQRNEQGECK